MKSIFQKKSILSFLLIFLISLVCYGSRLKVIVIKSAEPLENVKFTYHNNNFEEFLSSRIYRPFRRWKEDGLMRYKRWYEIRFKVPKNQNLIMIEHSKIRKTINVKREKNRKLEILVDPESFETGIYKLVLNNDNTWEYKFFPDGTGQYEEYEAKRLNSLRNRFSALGNSGASNSNSLESHSQSFTQVRTKNGKTYNLKNAVLSNYIGLESSESTMKSIRLNNGGSSTLIPVKDIKSISIFSVRKGGVYYHTTCNVNLRTGATVEGEMMLSHIRGNDASTGLLTRIRVQEINSITFP